jgi:FkbM family methyltransferase
MTPEVERLLTVSAVNAASLLRGYPRALERFARVTRKYVDWRGRTVVCRTRFGARIPCDLSDLIQRKIAYFGIWEPNLTGYLRRALAPGNVFVDVGANIGYYALLGAKLVGPQGLVVAIEASPKIFASLSENIARNRAKNVRAVNRAAAYESGRMPVFAAPHDNIGRTSTVPTEGNCFESFVEAEPLHRILTAGELWRARMIKIDIEGAEGPVVKSFAENVSLYGPQCELAIEVSPACSWILETMGKLGFHAYRMANDYSDRDYLRGAPQPPERYRQDRLDEQSDFVFSRIDADYL